MTDDARPSWSESGRFLPRQVVRPTLEFFQVEASGGIVMLVAAIAALGWANSPWQASYATFWETEAAIHVGGLVHLDLDLRAWVGDGLMAVFFLVVGLEIKRELVVGELRDRRAAALPALAALGGMAVPALIFLAFNLGGAGAHGWGIPMATDIAFAAAVVSLLGDRVPSGAKMFLLTLAVVDDLGAIVVIAIFYTSDLALGWLGLAFGTVVVAYLIQRADVRSLIPFATLGVTCWYALHESGVHPTIAGVAFGLLCPAYSFYDPARFGPRARAIVDGVVDARGDDQPRLRDLQRLATESVPPLDRIVHRLGPWVSFVIVPLFALASAGVHLTGEALRDAPGNRVVLGVAVGLVVGKTLGILTASRLAVRLGIGRLPDQTGWSHVLGLAATAGIGFTVAIFVTGLSFEQAGLADQAKIGILAGSAFAGVLGYGVLRRVAGKATARA
ncbi:MAG: Na+/H+ antiporter NhaA [Acidimicrobiia bacterium]